MFKWRFVAVIYRKMSSAILYEKQFETYEEAQAAIEENIGQFMDEGYPPTGHINKNYVKVDNIKEE